MRGTRDSETIHPLAADRHARGAVLDALGAAAALVFFSAALAIVPLATVIVHGTEHLATRTGPALGGLLNATFGARPAPSSQHPSARRG
jgi:hypothetical protein